MVITKTIIYGKPYFNAERSESKMELSDSFRGELSSDTTKGIRL